MGETAIKLLICECQGRAAILNSGLYPLHRLLDPREVHLILSFLVTITLLQFFLPGFEDTSSVDVFKQNHRPPVFFADQGPVECSFSQG